MAWMWGPLGAFLAVPAEAAFDPAQLNDQSAGFHVAP
jgi:hypothetical protein